MEKLNTVSTVLTDSTPVEVKVGDKLKLVRGDIGDSAIVEGDAIVGDGAVVTGTAHVKDSAVICRDVGRW